MPKEEWGTKRVCPNCETRFYDLRRDPAGWDSGFDAPVRQGGRPVGP
jgi:hypothetical protein